MLVGPLKWIKIKPNYHISLSTKWNQILIITVLFYTNKEEKKREQHQSRVQLTCIMEYNVPIKLTWNWICRFWSWHVFNEGCKVNFLFPSLISCRPSSPIPVYITVFTKNSCNTTMSSLTTWMTFLLGYLDLTLKSNALVTDAQSWRHEPVGTGEPLPDLQKVKSSPHGHSPFEAAIVLLSKGTTTRRGCGGSGIERSQESDQSYRSDRCQYSHWKNGRKLWIWGRNWIGGRKTYVWWWEWKVIGRVL